MNLYQHYSKKIPIRINYNNLKLLYSLTKIEMHENLFFFHMYRVYDIFIELLLSVDHSYMTDSQFIVHQK